MQFNHKLHKQKNFTNYCLTYICAIYFIRQIRDFFYFHHIFRIFQNLHKELDFLILTYVKYH